MPFYLIAARDRGKTLEEIQAYEMLGLGAYVYEVNYWALYADRNYYTTYKEPTILHPDYSLITDTERARLRDYARERYENGETFGTLPEAWPVYPSHMAYASTKFPGQVAYTPDDRHLLEDRQVTTLPGRYLKKFWPMLPDDEIAYLASMFGVLPELQITQDADTCERIYRRMNLNTRAPYWRSCMGPEGYDGALLDGEFPSFPWYDHPARVYAGPDLAIAYLGTPDNATARVVCWPERKQYRRIYSDNPGILQAFKSALAAAGFTECTKRDGTTFAGARIRKIRHSGGGYVMPYLDGVDAAGVRGDYIVLGEGGLPTTNIHGVTELHEEEQYECTNCGCSIDADDSYCSSCDDARWTCAHCGDESFDYDDAHTSASGESFCRACYRENVQDCPVCEEECNEYDYSPMQRRVRRTQGLASLHIHTACYESHTTCETCEAWVPYDDVLRGADDDCAYCATCHAEHVAHVTSTENDTENTTTTTEDSAS